MISFYTDSYFWTHCRYHIHRCGYSCKHTQSWKYVQGICVQVSTHSEVTLV